MRKYRKLIVIIIVFVAVLLLDKPSYAMSQEDAGEALADFSIYFYKHYGSSTRYSVDGRENTYRGQTTNGLYLFDCVGWVDFAIHQCLKLGGESMEYFAVPPGQGNNPWFRSGFELVVGDVYNPNNLLDREVVEDTLQPGDILFCGPGGPHVVIYVGDHNIIHCYSNLECEDLYDNDMHYTGYCAIGRITKETANKINEDNIVTMYEGEGYDEEGLAYHGTTTGHYKGTKQSNWLFENFLGFFDYLFGMIAYIIRAPFVGWANIVENMINDTIKNVSGVNITETSQAASSGNLNDSTQNVQNPGDGNQSNSSTIDTNIDDNTETDNTSENTGLYKPSANLKYENEHRINIEDVIYNRIPLLDVNFFDVDLSETKSDAKVTISKDSVIYKLRENVAIWYVIIRNFSIVSLLFVLIYLGIRLAISTTSGTKAKYKSMLTAWVTSFILVFFIHLFMIIVIEVNDYFVDIFKATEVKYTGGLSMYDTIRTRAYSFKLSEGIPATVMYMVLIYYLIRFLFVYFKRYFTVNILALLGPVAAIKYAYDKINKGKSNSMVSWMRDFALNVLLQSVHALLYTTLMIIAFEVGMESIPGFILALIILNFVFKAEDIFLSIFKFDAKSLGDVRRDKNYFAEAWGFTRGIGFITAATARFGFGAVVNTTKFVGDVGAFTGQFVTSAVTTGIWAVKNRDTELSDLVKGNGVPYQSVDFAENVKKIAGKAGGAVVSGLDNGFYNTTRWLNRKAYNIAPGVARAFSDHEVKDIKDIRGVRSLRLGLYKMKQKDPELYETTKKLIEQNDKYLKEVFTRSLTNGVRSIKTMTYLAASIPTIVVDPKSGFTMFSSALQDIKNSAEGTRHYGYQTKKEIRGRRGRVAAVVLTGGAGYAVVSAMDNIKENEKKLNTIKKNDIMMDDLRRAHILERDIEKESERIEKELEKQKEQLSTQDEKDAMDKASSDAQAAAIKATLDSVLRSRNLKGFISDYMKKNRMGKLTDSDVENLLRELNLDGITSEIDKIKGATQSIVDELRRKAEEIKAQISREVNNANSDADAQEAIRKLEKELKATEKKADRKEGELQVLDKIRESIASQPDLSDGYIKGQRNISATIAEYKGSQSDKKVLTESDIDKVVELFRKKVQNGDFGTYASREEIAEQFRSKDKDGKGLDRKGSTDAFISANEKADDGLANIDNRYITLSDQLRELQVLNQRFVNNNGKQAVSMSKIIENLKK